MDSILSAVEFAEAIARYLDETAFEQKLDFDQTSFALVIKDDLGNPIQTINLSRFYTMYKNTPDQLQDIFRRVTNTARERPDQESLANLELVAPRLMPGIYDTALFYRSWEKLRREYGPEVGDMPVYTIGEVFAFAPVIDNPESQLRVTPQMMAEWKLDFEEVFALAGENLVKATESFAFHTYKNKKTGLPSLYESTWGDGYDGARMLYEDFSALTVSGEQIFFIPSPDKLLIADSEDPVALAIAWQIVADAAETASALPPFALYKEEGMWSIYHSEDPQLEPMIKALQEKYNAQTYQQQREELLHQAHVIENDLFVSSYVVVQHPDQRLASHCTWTEGATSLLPVTDYITFAQINGEEATLVARGSWNDVMAVIEDQLEETDDFPLRFLTGKFPDADQLAAIGMCEVF